MDAPGQFEVLPFRRPGLPAIELPGVEIPDLYAALLERADKDSTRCEREKDIRDFCRFLGERDPRAACLFFVGRGRGKAHDVFLNYRSRLRKRELTPSTVNRRLSTLRTLAVVAGELGVIEWAVGVGGIPPEDPLRDTRGPGIEGWRAILAMLDSDPDMAKTRRDVAMVWLLGLGRGLRRGELVGLDLCDVDLSAPAVYILGKGRRQKRWFTVGPKTAAALARWIEARGRKPGPVFVPLDPGAGEVERLTGKGVWWICRQLGRRAALERPTHPHGLRHTAITVGLDSGRGVRDMMEFSRHKKLETLLIYDDRRKDIGGEVCRQLEDA